MKQTINFSQFTDAFRDHNRLDNFTYDGLEALFDYLEDLADDCGTDFELDVIALCCEFSEYSDMEELRGVYDDLPEDESDAEDWLQDHTSVITFNGGVIIQDF